MSHQHFSIAVPIGLRRPGRHRFASLRALVRRLPVIEAVERVARARAEHRAAIDLAADFHLPCALDVVPDDGRPVGCHAPRHGAAQRHPCGLNGARHVQHAVGCREIAWPQD